MCFYCKGKMRPSFTVYSTQVGEAVIVVKNVPCMECEQCGELEFDDATVARLEELTKAAERLMQEIAVIDYAKAA